MANLRFNKVTKNVQNISFDCGVHSINEYIKESYFPMICQQAYTYSIESDNVILGFYQILFRDVVINDFPENISDYDSEIKDGKITAAHIRFIAIDKKFQRKKIGTNVLQAIIKSIDDFSNYMPIRVITIDALVHLVDWYKQNGFVKMINNSEGQDGFSESMYFDCMKFSDELMQYLELCNM